MAKNTKTKGKGPYKGRDNRSGNKNVGRDFVPDQRSASPDSTRSKGDNDISWYSGFPQLMKDVSSIPFNVFPGVPRNLNYGAVFKEDNTWKYNRKSGKYATPGVCAIEYLPSIGISTSSTSAANVSARALYTYLRGMNAGKTNYEGCDSFLCCLGVAEAYAYYAYMCRIYGSIKYWDAQNRYAGKFIVKALGVDYNEMVPKLTNLRAYINYFATQINKLAVPVAIPLFARRIWCETGIYRDDNLAKSQFYFMKRDGWLIYEEMNGDKTYGRLNVWATPDSGLTLEDIIEMGERIIEPLLASEDINIICGDILKAFGNSGLAAAPQIAEDYVCVPQYNAEVLMQFKNTRFNKSSIANTNYPEWITQDPETGLIMHRPNTILNASGSIIPNQAMIDIPVDSVTPEMVMVATRLVTRWLPNSSSEPSSYKLDAVGTELPLGVVHYSIEAENNAQELIGMRCQSSYFDVSEDVGGNAVSIQDVIGISQFNAHPIIEAVYWNTGTDGHIAYGPIGNVTNLTYTDFDQINAMHDVACMSMFRVPGMKEFNDSKR